MDDFLTTEHHRLLRFAEAGDQAAFHWLVRRHLGFVLGTALRITGRRPLAEEVAQDVFTLLAARAGALARGNAPLAVWLHRTARFKALRARQSEQRRHRREERLRFMMNDDESPAWPEKAFSAEGGEGFPSSLLPHLDAALNRLSATDRAVILLRFYEELPHAEIAARLGLSSEAARQRSVRAVERLARHLKPHAGLTAGNPLLTTSLTAPFAGGASASPALAAAVAQSALASAPAVSFGAVFFNFLLTMDTAKTAACAAVLLCLAGIGWQEVSLATTQRELTRLRESSAAREAVEARENGALSAAIPARDFYPDESKDRVWERYLEELMRDEANPEALAEFARGFKQMVKGEVKGFPPGVFEYGNGLTPERMEKMAEISLSLELSPEERSHLWGTFVYSLSEDRPRAATRLAARVWTDILGNTENMRNAGRTAASRWAREDPEGALTWYREQLKTDAMSSGFRPEAAETLLGGGVLSGLLEKHPEQGKGFFLSLSVEDRGAVLHAAAEHPNQPEAARRIEELTAELLEGERAATLTKVAARLAAVSTFAEGREVFESAVFADPLVRVRAAGVIATAAAGAEGETAAQNRAEAWNWLNTETTGDTEQRKLQAEFLAAAIQRDPLWTLERFEESGGAVAGENMLKTILKDIRPGQPDIAPRAFALATGLEDPAEREWAVRHVVQAWKNQDEAAARRALDSLALPPEEAARAWEPNK